MISYKEADKPTVERAIAKFYARMKDAASQRPAVWEVCELMSACGRQQMIAEAEALYAAASARGGDVQRMEGTLHRAWCIAGVASKAEQMLEGRRRAPTFKELHGMLLLYARNADTVNLDRWMEKGRLLGVMTLKQYNVVLSGYGTVSHSVTMLSRLLLSLPRFLTTKKKAKFCNVNFLSSADSCAQRT